MLTKDFAARDSLITLFEEKHFQSNTNGVNRLNNSCAFII